ncbi:ABC transporter permease [Paenibacillus sp. 1P07SE]|uniref:ABC transporter permease n=1 Tax=Paenibacillus sp. 1P07SE TaxID=3132209 RepID=UPI0039A52B0B
MRQSLEALWGQRARAFRLEIFPYLRFMVQSGFPGFVVLMIILGMIGYGTLLREPPAGFPTILVGVILLTPVMCWSPMRTWLHPADTVFLMPREQEMAGYLRRSWVYNGSAAVLLMLGVLALFWPLYNRTVEHDYALPVLALVLVILKLFNMHHAWRERRMAWPGARWVSRLVRWLLHAVMIAMLLDTDVTMGRSLLFLAAASITYLLWLRLPKQHQLPWERLIEEEQATRRRYYRFLGAFIDVPVLAQRVQRRGYLAWLAARVPYRESHTYRYLFSQTMIRAELGGILVRLVLLGGLVGYLTGAGALLEGWGAAAAYLLFVFIVSVQARSVTMVHRYSVWRHIYPLPEARRQASAVAVVQLTTALCAILMWLPLAAGLVMEGLYSATAAAAVIAALYVRMVLPRRTRRRLASAEEE